jgi:hypothetical protein
VSRPIVHRLPTRDECLASEVADALKIFFKLRGVEACRHLLDRAI